MASKPVAGLIIAAPEKGEVPEKSGKSPRIEAAKAMMAAMDAKNAEAFADAWETMQRCCGGESGEEADG